MAAPKFQWNMRGFADVRGLPAVTAKLKAEAERRAATSGPGYETRGPEVARGRGRGRAAVITGDARARRAEATQHNLARG